MWAHSFAEHHLYTLADAGLIVASEHVDRRLCPLAKAPQPVLEPEGIFEGAGVAGRWDTYALQDGYHYGSILYDPHLSSFRYWYNPAAPLTEAFTAGRAGPLPSDGSLASAVAYATSPDGLTWERPDLGLVHHPFEGSRNLSILARPPIRTAHCPSVVRLPERFAPSRFATAFFSRCADPLYERGIFLAFSDDGLRWTSHFPPALPLDGDRKTFSWDAHRDEFVIVSRSHQHGNLARRWGVTRKRHIAISRSRDLQHWTPMRTVLEADAQDPDDVELYSMYVLPYGHGYLGFIEVFHTESNLLETQLAFSRDLLTWERVGDRAAFLAQGPSGSWDGAHICLTMNPPHLEAGATQLRFWYGGKMTPHWQAGYAALGTATLRRDGFVAASARGRPGTLITLPFHVAHHAVLYVNADARDGEVRAEVLDEAGQPVPGFGVEDCVPLREDAVRGALRFTGVGNNIRLPGRWRLRFHLRDATLYAFRLDLAEPLWTEN